MMELTLKTDNIQHLQKTLDFWESLNNPRQQQILNNNNKIICYKCGIDLHTKYDDETVTKIVNYCKIRYKIKNTDKYNIFCKDCQKTINGGATA